MAFNIDQRPERTAWVNFSDDEKYLLKYMPMSEYNKVEKANSEKKAQEIFFAYVLDWDGIVDKDGNKIECNDDNKKIVFVDLELDSVERQSFCWLNMMNPNNFYDIKANLKNLKRG